MQYYMNHEIISAEPLKHDRVLIKVDVEATFDDDGGGPCVEYADVELIVDKKDLRDKKIEPDKELRQKLREMRNQFEIEKREATSKLRSEIRDLKDRKDEITKGLKKWEGLYESLAFLDDEYQWVVIADRWHDLYDIVKLSDIVCSYNKRELAAVVIRHNNKMEFKSYVSEYNDGSGSDRRLVKFFKEHEDAKNLVTEKMDKYLKGRTSNKASSILAKIKKYKLESPTISAFIEKVEKESKTEKQKDVDQKRKALSQAQAELEAVLSD